MMKLTDVRCYYSLQLLSGRERTRFFLNIYLINIRDGPVQPGPFMTSCRYFFIQEEKTGTESNPNMDTLPKFSCQNLNLRYKKYLLGRSFYRLVFVGFLNTFIYSIESAQ